MEGQKTGALPGQEKPDGQQVRQLLGRQAAVIFDLDGTLVDSMWMWEQLDIYPGMAMSGRRR